MGLSSMGTLNILFLNLFNSGFLCFCQKKTYKEPTYLLDIFLILKDRDRRWPVVRLSIYIGIINLFSSLFFVLIFFSLNEIDFFETTDEIWIFIFIFVFIITIFFTNKIFYFCFHLVVFEYLSPTDSIKKSYQAFKKNKRFMLGVTLLGFLITILSIPTLGIAYLIYHPVSVLTSYKAYEEVFT